MLLVFLLCPGGNAVTYFLMHFHHFHLDRTLSFGRERERERERWREGSRRTGKLRKDGGGSDIKEEKFLWKLRGDEEEGKSPSNTRASSASNSPCTEAGWNEIPYTKLESNCASAVCVCVCACCYAASPLCSIFFFCITDVWPQVAIWILHKWVPIYLIS